MSLRILKDRALQDPETKKEYERLNAEFELIDALLTMRQESGLTQDEVARRMGTQKSNISRLEKGSANPS